MPDFSVKNFNKPVSPYWSKFAAACQFISLSLLGAGTFADEFTLRMIVFTSMGANIIGGVILIFTNGTPKPFTRNIESEMKKGADSSAP